MSTKFPREPFAPVDKLLAALWRCMKNKPVPMLTRVQSGRLGWFLLASLFVGMFAGATAHAQCPAGGLAVVVNKSNATEGLSTAQLRRLLLGDLRNWPDKKRVSVITPNQQSAAFKCLLASVVRMSDAEYHRFVASLAFRGEEPLDLHVAGSDPAAVKMISATPGGIAIIEAAPLATTSSVVRVLRINGKQPGEVGYPIQKE